MKIALPFLVLALLSQVSLGQTNAQFERAYQISYQNYYQLPKKLRNGDLLFIATEYASFAKHYIVMVDSSGNYKIKTPLNFLYPQYISDFIQISDSLVGLLLYVDDCDVLWPNAMSMQIVNIYNGNVNSNTGYITNTDYLNYSNLIESKGKFYFSNSINDSLRLFEIDSIGNVLQHKYPYINTTTPNCKALPNGDIIIKSGTQTFRWNAMTGFTVSNFNYQSTCYFNHRMYATNNSYLYKLDASGSVIDSTNSNFLINPNCEINDGKVALYNNYNSSSWQVVEFDTALTSIQSYTIAPQTNLNFTQQKIYVCHNKLVVCGQHFTPNDNYDYRLYLKSYNLATGQQYHGIQKPQITNIQVTNIQGTAQYLGSNAPLGIDFTCDANVTLKNNSTVTLDSLIINLGPESFNWICGGELLFKKFKNLNLQPGDSIQLSNIPYHYYLYSFQQPPLSHQISAWCSAPNGECINDTNGTGKKYHTFTLTNLLGVDVQEIQKAIISLSPNPASSSFRILGLPNSDNSLQSITITDLQGRIILDTKASFNSDINISNFPRGVYFVSITNSDNKKTFKLQKE